MDLRILITFIGPWLDKGEAAMLISMKDALQQQIPDIAITAEASSWGLQNIDIVKYGERSIKVLPGMFNYYYLLIPKLGILKFKAIKAVVAIPFLLYPITINTLWLGLHRLQRLNGRILSQASKNKNLNKFCEADWIIFCGGEYIKKTNLVTFIALYEIIFSKSLCKPVMLYGQSFGPFDQKWAQPIIKRILDRVDLITTREEISKDYLENLGVTAPVFVTADAAFMLPSITKEEALSLIKHETKLCIDNTVMVGITAIYADYQPKNKDAYKTRWNYVVSMANSIDYLINKLNAFVVFYPHNKTTHKFRNDEAASNEIYDLVRNKSRVILLTEDYSPEQLKGMYSCMDLFIGTRYHSCIFALSMCVPTIAIGYSHKAEGIMKLLGMDKYVCDINTITPQELASTIDKTWENRAEIREKLGSNIQIMQARCIDNIKLAVEYLGQRKSL